MADPLKRVRTQIALVNRLTEEQAAAQAHLDELTRQLEAAQEGVITKSITAYEEGATPQQIYDLTGIKRGSLHYRRNLQAERSSK